MTMLTDYLTSLARTAHFITISFFHLSCQVAINWCICKGTVPIPGVKSIKQAEENLGALGWRLSSDELLRLDYAANESPRRMIQNIFQTRYTYFSYSKPDNTQNRGCNDSSVLFYVIWYS